MHRVELKEGKAVACATFRVKVPNAPCGVESHFCGWIGTTNSCEVPNAPCGAKSLELKEKGLNF